MVKRRIALLTSGGDAPGMNPAIRAVTRKAIFHDCQVIGVARGYQGLINGDFQTMQINSVAGIIQQGGTMLKTARCEQFKTAEGFAKALHNLRDQKIDSVVVIGGDGSMAGAKKLSAAGIDTVVIPATIDNDMPGTEYALGYDTALNTILEAVNKIRDTVCSHDRVAVVEVMGRHGGQLALIAGIACGAETVIIPEIPYDMEQICQGLIRSNNRGKLYSIVLVAEGAGRGYDIASQIAARTSFSTHVTVLGYIQRGGSPTATDSIVASRMGAAAVDAIIAGKGNCLISLQKGDIAFIPYEEAAGYKPVINRQLYDLTGILGI